MKRTAKTVLFYATAIIASQIAGWTFFYLVCLGLYYSRFKWLVVR